MADLATLKKYLAEAESALHQLQLGKSVVQIHVATNGESQNVTYRGTNIDQLRLYVGELKGQITALESATGQPKRGPIYLEFC